MKKMIKNAVLSMAALFLGASVFAEVSFNAYNKISTDTVVISHNDSEDEDDNYFPGFKNRVFAEVTSDKVDAMIKADINITRFEDKDEDGDTVYSWGIAWDDIIKDWYVEIRPVQFITLGFHDNIFPTAANLPIYDDDLLIGNIGSDGFTFVGRPTWDGGYLRLAATIPFSADNYNYFYSKTYKNEKGEEVEAKTFDFGLGAILNLDLFELGVTFQDIIDNDERVIGVYASFPKIFNFSEASTLNVGYAHSEAAAGVADLTEFGGILGNNIINAVYTYEGENSSLTAEFLTNCKEDDTFADADTETFCPWDIYAAASFSFNLTEKLSLTFTGKTLFDLSKKEDQGGEAKPVVAGAANASLQLTEHSLFEAEVDIDGCDGSYVVKFPISWKYTF